MECYTCGWKGLPNNLKTKSGLNKLGLETVENPIAKIKVGCSFYDLYDINSATEKKVTIIHEGKTYKYEYALYKNKIPENYKTKNELKKMKLEPIEDSIMTIKISDRNPIELYDILKTKPLVIEKAVSNELGIYECDWDSIPDNLKTKGALSKIGLIPVGKPVAQINKNNNFYDLYDVRYVIPMKNSKRTDWECIIKNLTDNPKDYVILNIVSTGQEDDDEVIQLSIIDLQGNCIFNEYFNAQKESAPSYLNKHKIGQQFLSKYPSWAERWIEIDSLLKDKIIIMYNSIKSELIIKQTCKKYSIDEPELNIIHINQYLRTKYKTLTLEETMENLHYPFNIGNLHNSLIDCFMCLFSINKNAELFKVKKESENIFNNYCNRRIKEGHKDSYQRGYNWIRNTFRLNNIGVDFKFFDLKLCNKIKESLPK